jgi:hypothetical protein
MLKVLSVKRPTTKLPPLNNTQISDMQNQQKVTSKRQAGNLSFIN